MTSYQIKKLRIEDYYKCSTIWEMEKNPKMTEGFYKELINGNRMTFIYLENNEFVGEGSLVFQNDDPDYTIPVQVIASIIQNILNLRGCRN